MNPDQMPKSAEAAGQNPDYNPGAATADNTPVNYSSPTIGLRDAKKLVDDMFNAAHLGDRTVNRIDIIKLVRDVHARAFLAGERSAVEVGPDGKTATQRECDERIKEAQEFIGSLEARNKHTLESWKRRDNEAAMLKVVAEAGARKTERMTRVIAGVTEALRNAADAVDAAVEIDHQTTFDMGDLRSRGIVSYNV